MDKLISLQELTRLRESIRTKMQQRQDTGSTISIGMGTCGIAAGARETLDAILEELKTRQLEVNVRSVGCIGICIKEPLVEIQQAGGSHVLYANILPDMVPRLIEQHLIRGEPVRQWIACRISD